LAIIIAFPVKEKIFKQPAICSFCGEVLAKDVHDIPNVQKGTIVECPTCEKRTGFRVGEAG